MRTRLGQREDLALPARIPQTVKRAIRLATATSVLGLGLVAPTALAGTTAHLEKPGWVRDSHRALGAHDPRSPITHVVIVMQENHSFDEYFGMLPREGQPKADGFTFDSAGRPINSNPLPGGKRQLVFHQDQPCSGPEAGQSWNNTHKEIDGGRMDGFAAIEPHSMSYYDKSDLPFYYSLANTFTLANRWFSSAPAQTYPNRRFLYAGTAYGNISTTTSSYFDPPPPHGTIMDEFAKYNVSWHDYVTDLPDTALIGSNLENHPSDYTSIAQFYADAKLGTLPDVSYVESEDGAAGIATDPVRDQVGAAMGGSEPQQVKNAFYWSDGTDEDEEDSDVRLGQAFVSRVVNAVMSGPDWQHTLLIWLYDEHGGFYDHVAVPSAIKPDNIPPALGPGDIKGGYDMYGVRVPAVVVSAWSKKHAVTNVVHDHTSVVAEIEELWNLPALTYRDANAADLSDFLDFRHETFAAPPTLAAPNSADLTSCHTT